MNPPEPERYTPAQLDALRRHAEALLEAATQRVCGPSPDPVTLCFDWRPSVTHSVGITFLVDITRGERRSQIKFEIDLGRLSTLELEQVHAILVARHAGTDDAVSLTRSVTWLLEISIGHAHPEFSTETRQAKVRELLLTTPKRTP